MTTQDVLQRLERVKQHGDYWMACCPAHEDKKASLKVSEGDDGRVLLYCHAGCKFEQIVGTLGVSASDLLPPDKKVVRSSSRGLGKLLASFDYHDEQGQVLFQVRRYEGKEFRQGVPDPSTRDGIRWGLRGVRLVPLNLPRVIEQSKAGKTVFVVEGEKDVFALAALGLIATTNAGGAGKWLPGFGKFLTGAHVVILPDNDEPGAKHGLKVAESCLSHAASVRIVDLPGLPAKGDVSDWLQSGGTKEALMEIIKAVGPITNFSPYLESQAYKTYKTPETAEDEEAEPSFKDTHFSLDLNPELMPVVKLMPEMLPPALRGWLWDMAQRLSCPLEYVAIPAVVALGAVIGRKVGIRPKRFDDWLEYPNLWGAIVGKPGALKTPAISEALKPLHRLEAIAREQHEINLENFSVAQVIAKAKADASKDKLKKLARVSSPTDKQLQDLQDAAMETLGGEDTDSPTCARRIVNDPTVEKLGELLRENPNGLLLYRDELTGFLRTLDRQGHESDRAFYLEAWNGKGCFTYDRIGRGTVFLPSLCLSLVGTIQPGPLASYLRSASSERGDDGFSSRFQLLVWPDAVPFRLVDRYSNAEAKAAATRVFEELADMTAETIDAQQDEDGTVYLRFTPDAQEIFYKWLTGLEERMRGSGETTLMETHLSKYRKMVPALALIFHVLESSGPVSKAALERALVWAEFLESHARRIYQAVGDGDPEAGQRLAQRIKASLFNPFTIRQVVQKGWSGLGTTEEVERAIAFLEERGWVKTREVQKATGGRPSIQVWINPEIKAKCTLANEKDRSFAENGSETKFEIPTTRNLQNLQNPTKDSFVGFVGSSYQTSQKNNAQPEEFEEGEL